MDWHKLLITFAKQFAAHVKANADNVTNQVTCFVIDDTDIEKTGKTFEYIRRIYNHV